MQRIARFALIVMGMMSLTLVQCGGGSGKDEDKNPESSKPKISADQKKSSNDSCSNGTALTYENFAKDFMETHCISCHQAGSSFKGASAIPLNTQDHLQVYRVRIMDAAVDAGTMPPGYKVSEGEKTLLQEWLSCGAP